MIADLDNPLRAAFHQRPGANIGFRNPNWVTNRQSGRDLDAMFTTGVALTLGEADTLLDYRGQGRPIIAEFRDQFRQMRAGNSMRVDNEDINFPSYRMMWLRGTGHDIYKILCDIYYHLMDYIESSRATEPNFPPRRPDGVNYMILRHHLDLSAKWIGRNRKFCIRCQLQDHHSSEYTDCAVYLRRQN